MAYHEQLSKMVIKESSDELNPPVIALDATPGTARPVRSPKDYLALTIATCGVGYLPLAPGTWGSLVALGFYLLLRRSWFPHSDLEPNAYPGSFLVVEIVIIMTVTLLGTWAASRTERISLRKDPGKVVVDEVAGQLIALMAVPLTNTGPPILLVAAFVLFRFFDIVKPYPARKLESLKGGLGIMADDLIAGVYAAIIVGVVAALGLLS